MEVSATGWAVTIGLVVCLFVFDLILAAARPHAIGIREALTWSSFYIAIAIGFGLVFTWQVGDEYGTQYFAGYLVEKSLSVDNLFVFAIIMSTFAVPDRHQHKMLTLGIIAALVLRAVFIALGATLIEMFSFVFLIFGVLLIWTAVQLFRHRNEDPDVDDNGLVRLTRRILPVSDFDGGKLLTRVDGGRAVTPLFIVLLAIGSADLLFALDSIPAVFGVTEQAYIVLVANAFALLGLRALFFLVKGLLDRFVYLSTGLALILSFIGLKLVLHWGHDIDGRVPEISTNLSLAVIVVVLVAVAIASVVKVRRDPAARAHAGSLRHHEPDGAEPRD